MRRVKLRSLRSDLGRFVHVDTTDGVRSGVLTEARRSGLVLRSPQDTELHIPRSSVKAVEVRGLFDGWILADRSYFGRTATGQAVTPPSAISGTIAVYRCVSLIAASIGMLPVHLYRRISDAQRDRVMPGDGDRELSGRGYPGSLARVLGELPNPEMSAQTLWETAVGHAALWGSSWLNVVRGPDGRVSELWPLRPDRIEPHRDRDGSLYYIYAVKEGDRRILLPEEVMRVPWLGLDGIEGISPIMVARNAVAIEQASGKWAAGMYARGAAPSSIVTIPKGPQEKFKERAGVYRDTIEGLYGGMDNAGRIAVVEEGVTWQAVGMKPADLQFIETREWEAGEIGRLYGVPAHMLGINDKDTSWGTGLESQKQGFLDFTLMPPIGRIQEGCNLHLGLVPGRRTLRDEGLYVEFQTAAILRADLKTRYSAYEIGIRNRWLTPQQVAAMESLGFDAERPDAYENPNVLSEPDDGQTEPDESPSAPRPPAPRADGPPVNVTVNIPEPRLTVDVPQPQVTVKVPAPRVEVHLPEPPPPQVVVNVPEPRVEVHVPEFPPVQVVLPEPRAVRKRVKRNKSGEISEIIEEPYDG